MKTLRVTRKRVHHYPLTGAYFDKAYGFLIVPSACGLGPKKTAFAWWGTRKISSALVTCIPCAKKMAN